MAKSQMPPDEAEALGARIGEMAAAAGGPGQAARIAGITTHQLRRIVLGESTGTSAVTLAKLATATGYDLNWVMTGQGSRLRLEAAPAPTVLDPRLLGRLFEALSRLYREMGVRLSEAQLGELAAEEYKDVAAAAGGDDEQLAMVKLVVARHRRRIEEENLAARKREA